MVNSGDEKLKNEFKKVVWNFFLQKLSIRQDDPYDQTTNDIIGNLDRLEYLTDKYGITEKQIQECYQALADNLASNPNVIRQVAEMVAIVRSYLAEGIGRQITNEEITPVTEVIGKLTITLLIEKNMWWARQDYEKQE
ncbi:MAG: hypothetical protein I3274_05860 [Candidatus Moeniiplasma glomeromycotorum]|nr:hypothetical protein [Candidatus Moeniiplasma glomeromycotorum]